jgi:hypothetical protein
MVGASVPRPARRSRLTVGQSALGQRGSRPWRLAQQVDLKTIKDGAELGGDLLGGLGRFIRQLRYRPKLQITAEIGVADMLPAYVPGSFVWLNVQNRAVNPHATARGLIGHVWIDDASGIELFRLRGRWRKGDPSIDIGPGITEQLDSVWKFPSESDAFGLGDQAIAAAPHNWQAPRYLLPPGVYRLRAQVQGLNASAEARFWVRKMGAGTPLTVTSGTGPTLVPPEPSAVFAPERVPTAPDSPGDPRAKERIWHSLDVFDARIEYVLAWHRRGRWQPLKARRLALQAQYPDAMPEEVLAGTTEWATYIALERRLRDDTTTPISKRVEEIEATAQLVRDALHARE